jgi:negative regulator of sigma-B (phosphoserine phosphatase)
MTTIETVLEGVPLSVGVAWRPMYADDVCGDLFFAGSFDRGALIAAIDGGGHGEEARVAATAVVDALRAVSAEPLERALPAIHAATRDTRRGAAIAVARVIGRRVEWVSIGNVAGGIFRGGALLREVRRDAGSIGINLPVFDVAALDVEPGDALVLATDGVDRRFLMLREVKTDARELASDVLARFREGSDDALVLAAVLDFERRV